MQWIFGFAPDLSANVLDEVKKAKFQICLKLNRETEVTTPNPSLEKDPDYFTLNEMKCGIWNIVSFSFFKFKSYFRIIQYT